MDIGKTILTVKVFAYSCDSSKYHLPIYTWQMLGIKELVLPSVVQQHIFCKVPGTG